MTKKDYDRLANLLKCMRGKVSDDDFHVMYDSLVETLKQDNDRFDEDIFEEAVYGEEE